MSRKANEFSEISQVYCRAGWKQLTETQNKTTQMRPNQSRAVLIFPITPTTTWLFAGYPYTTGTQKAAKFSNKNSIFNWEHCLHTALMNASHSTNLFTNSCNRVSTNGNALLHSHINHNNPQFLYSLWRRAKVFHGGNSTFINSFDKTKHLFWSPPPTQHHSFFRN